MASSPTAVPPRLLGRALLHHQRRWYCSCGAVARISRVGSAGAGGIGDTVGRNFRVADSIFSRASSNLTRSDDSVKTISSSLHPLPAQFLQESDAKLFDPLTHQRNDVRFDIIDGRPPLTHRTAPHIINHEDNVLPSELPEDWTRSQAERWRAKADDFDDHSSLDLKSASIVTTPESMANGMEAQPRFAITKNAKRILWSNWTEDMIRDPIKSPILFWYDDLIDGKGNADNSNSSNDSEERRLLQALYQYGLVLIRGTPTYTDSLSAKDMSESSKEIRRRVMNNSNVKDCDHTAESAILHLASIVGYHPLRTLYGGGIWSTSSYSSFYNKADDGESDDESSSSSAASTADSSYGSSSLPLHTDMTYVSNPPGVQVFLMVQPAEPAVSPTFSNHDDGNKKVAIVPKGQSVYLDGFAAARQLLLENPDAYCMLASTPRRYRCIDADLGWHLEATGPVIEPILSRGLDGCDDPPVKSIRHNDLDRLPDLPPYPSTNDASVKVAKYNSFYRSLREAHAAWDDILRRDSMRFVIDLQAGDCVLVSNQRCMHGRYAFETSKCPRVIMGCYVGMDELASKWRRAGLQVLY